MARQFHVTIYAIVEGDKITGWEICEPDASPGSGADEQIFNDVTEEWERTFEEDGPIWSEVDGAVAQMLKGMQP